MSALTPQQRTFTKGAVTSALCATCGLTRRSKQRLFDHLVGADEERLRHGKAERLRRLQVDHEFAHILLKEPPKPLRGGRSDNKNADGRHFWLRPGGQLRKRTRPASRCPNRVGVDRVTA